MQEVSWVKPGRPDPRAGPSPSTALLDGQQLRGGKAQWTCQLPSAPGPAQGHGQASKDDTMPTFYLQAIPLSQNPPCTKGPGTARDILMCSSQPSWCMGRCRRRREKLPHCNQQLFPNQSPPQCALPLPRGINETRQQQRSREWSQCQGVFTLGAAMSRQERLAAWPVPCKWHPC